MNREEYIRMFKIEVSHWWYVGMKNISMGILGNVLQKDKQYEILDTGCGTGQMMKELSVFGDITGIDFVEIAVAFCKQRGIQKVHLGSVDNLPFENNQFDLVTSFDVLCQLGVQSDAKPLQEFARVLKNDGLLLLRVPAYNWLRGKHDEAVQTRERYSIPKMRHRLNAAGFDVLKITHTNTLLLPIALPIRFFLNTHKDLEMPPKIINKILTRILNLESILIKKINLPIGLSVVALARKRCKAGGQYLPD